MTARMSRELGESKRKPLKFEVNLAVATALMTTNQEQHKIRVIAATKIYYHSVMASLCLFSIFLGILINELCSAGEYVADPPSSDQSDLR